MVKTIIWDFDGTLVNSYPKIINSFMTVLRSKSDSNYTYSEIEALVKIDTRYCANKIGQKINVDENIILSLSREEYDKNNNENVTLFPNAEKVLKYFKNKDINFLITHRDKKSTYNYLNDHALVKYFEEIITKEDGFPEKPNPSSFNHLIGRYNLEKINTFGIGDRDIDVDAANNAGINSIYFSENGNKNIVARYNITNLIELVEICNGA